MKQVGARHDIIREWRSLPKESQESGSKTSGIERNTSSRQTENTTAKQKLNKTLETEVQGYLASKELQPPK
jgi:hypothetical protein